MRTGAIVFPGNQCEFTVWAPFAKSVAIRLLSPESRDIALTQSESGYWTDIVEDVTHGSRYWVIIDGDRLLPDPSSRFQASGTHGASTVLDTSSFQWNDSTWGNIRKEDMVVYELHVGTFTPEGTFDAIISRLDELRETGITALELLPISQFPGDRNWGYDTVFPYAPQNSYGGPEGLARLVDAAHSKGIAILLDVVYNHLGPEGNYLPQYGPYFSTEHTTPWGQALNFDGAYSDPVRDFFIENALYWLKEYHIDGLRLDAIHGIFDSRALHFMSELSCRVDVLSKDIEKPLYIIAESDLNDPRVVDTCERNGFGMSAQWCDDFHHALHSLLVESDSGYYLDFGNVSQLADSYMQGFVYVGQYSHFRKKSHGAPSSHIPRSRFVAFTDNHDQAGNRCDGLPLAGRITPQEYRLAMGAMLVSPFVPMFWMGQEYGEDTPFYYFIDHNDADLIEAVREGRKAEFIKFFNGKIPPDPDALSTFNESKIEWGKRREEGYSKTLAYNQKLLRLRRKLPSLGINDGAYISAKADEDAGFLVLQRGEGSDALMILMHFAGEDAKVRIVGMEGKWRKILDSSDEKWGGEGALLEEEMTLRDAEDITVNKNSIAIYQKDE